MKVHCNGCNAQITHYRDGFCGKVKHQLTKWINPSGVHAAPITDAYTERSHYHLGCLRDVLGDRNIEGTESDDERVIFSIGERDIAIDGWWRHFNQSVVKAYQFFRPVTQLVSACAAYKYNGTYLGVAGAWYLSGKVIKFAEKRGLVQNYFPRLVLPFYSLYNRVTYTQNAEAELEFRHVPKQVKSVRFQD